MNNKLRNFPIGCHIILTITYSIFTFYKIESFTENDFLPVHINFNTPQSYIWSGLVVVNTFFVQIKSNPIENAVFMKKIYTCVEWNKKKTENRCNNSSFTTKIVFIINISWYIKCLQSSRVDVMSCLYLDTIYIHISNIIQIHVPLSLYTGRDFFSFVYIIQQKPFSIFVYKTNGTILLVGTKKWLLRE